MSISIGPLPASFLRWDFVAQSVRCGDAEAQLRHGRRSLSLTENRKLLVLALRRLRWGGSGVREVSREGDGTPGPRFGARSFWLPGTTIPAAMGRAFPYQPIRDLLDAAFKISCSRQLLLLRNSCTGSYREWISASDGPGSVHRSPPVASWLNQIEIVFSLLQRKTLNGGSFKSKDQLKYNKRRGRLGRACCAPAGGRNAGIRNEAKSQKQTRTELPFFAL